MRALGTTAPAVSATVPRKPASLTDCARADGQDSSAMTATSQAAAANLNIRITTSQKDHNPASIPTYFVFIAIYFV
jgi:hypothetical protein